MNNKTDIRDLYFGVVIPTEVGGKVKYNTQNLFGSVRVLTSVARWATMKPERKKEISNPLFYLFGDTWSRVEWEFLVCPFITRTYTRERPLEKVDVYKMYVQPNAELLLAMVENITKSSAEKYLRKSK